VHCLLGGDLLVKELLDQRLRIVDHKTPSIRDWDTPMPLSEVVLETVAASSGPIATWLRAIQPARDMSEYVTLQVLPSAVILVAI